MAGCLAAPMIGGMSDLRAQVRIDTAYAVSRIRPFDEPINPDRYLIRPGERLEVTFIDVNLPGLVLEVNPEGQVVNSGLGVIDLSGMNLRQAREVLIQRLNALFHADQIVVSIGSIYPVPVQVFGMVNRPGIYFGYTSQRVREIIDSADGIAPGGSSRRIVFRGGPKDIVVDLDQALYTDKQGYNSYLYAGKKLFVPELSQASVTVIGEIVYPRAVELLPGEGFAELLALVGGAKSNADTAAAYALNDPTRNIHQSGGIHPGDQILVPLSKSARGREEVVVSGAVKSAGARVLWDSSRTVAGLIEAAGGLTPVANRDRIAVFRLALSERLAERLSRRFPIWVPVDQFQSFRLQAFDSVFVPLRLGFVEITGDVVRPGLYPFADRLKVSDLVAVAGGYVSFEGQPVLEIFDHVTGMTRTVSGQTPVSDGDKVSVLAPVGVR